MKLQEFLDQDLCDVPVSASLKDGSKLVFRCDGSNSDKLTGMFLGASVFLPFDDILEIEVISESQFKTLSKGAGLHWYRS